MATAREIFLELLTPDGKAKRALKQYEPLYPVLNDPVNGYLMGVRQRGKTTKDRWGTTIRFPEDAPGGQPYITDETKVCPDVTRWRDYVHAPDLAARCGEGWEACRASFAGVDRGRYLITAFMGTGIFEQCHFLMGFEDTLTNLYEYPEEMHALIDYITDYRIAMAKMLIDGLQPDALLSHDDWGTKTSLFMSPAMWREFFKEPYRRFYGYIRSRGVITIHHADSFLAPITEDMAEIGIQAWQGVLPENNIPALQEKLQGRLLLMGGVGAAIDRADAQEPEIRAYVRRVLDENMPGGHYIPCITYGMAGTVFPHVDPLIDDEIDAWNRDHPSAAAPVRRRRAAAPAAASKPQPAEELPPLEALAAALRRGQSKKVLQLVQSCLDSGLDAQTILSDGLVRGMGLLGDDFSANRAFVPEMLVAARSMNAATALLKPHLQGVAAASAGRVCLGTVRGDMHDIGKNLVKIMMEGCGLEVVDLGVDVSAEAFLDAAAEKNCGLVACSSLLTTSMPEMRRVVELARERGVRDRLRILIGGAPITQEFCDAIGADGYTSDAAQAARRAVELLAV